MRRALGWMCYRTVMMWPGAWPSGAVAGWILAWAGDYATASFLVMNDFDRLFLSTQTSAIHVDPRFRIEAIRKLSVK